MKSNHPIQIVTTWMIALPSVLWGRHGWVRAKRNFFGGGGVRSIDSKSTLVKRLGGLWSRRMSSVGPVPVSSLWTDTRLRGVALHANWLRNWNRIPHLKSTRLVGFSAAACPPSRAIRPWVFFNRRTPNTHTSISPSFFLIASRNYPFSPPLHTKRHQKRVTRSTAPPTTPT